MALCPLGHPSEQDDFCDRCGTVMGPASPPARAAPGPGGSSPASTRPPRSCPACTVLNDPSNLYCEDCGAEMSGGGPAAATSGGPAPPPPTPVAGWELVATCDRAFFDRVVAGDVPFPEVAADRRFALHGRRVTIGRRSESRRIHPDVDLSTPPTDTGISHSHAVLLYRDDDSWAVIDSSSANGVYVNDGETPIDPAAIRTLVEGDRIHVGAWTTLTIQRVIRPRADG
jgi:FHA domain